MEPIPPASIALTVLLACFAASLVFLAMHCLNQRRAARLMCEQAEQKFFESLSQRSVRHEAELKKHAIAVEEAVIHRQGSHAFAAAAGIKGEAAPDEISEAANASHNEKKPGGAQQHPLSKDWGELLERQPHLERCGCRSDLILVARVARRQSS